MGYFILYSYFVWQRYSICMIVFHSMTSLNPTNRFYSTHWLQTDKHIKENKGMVVMVLGLCPSNSQGHLYLGPLFEFHRWGSFSTASRRHFRSECHDIITLPQHYLTFIVYPVNVTAKRREHNVAMRALTFGPFIIFTLRK